MSTENSNGKSPAFPTDYVVTDSFGHTLGIESKQWSGMSKREYFAAMAMQGILAESSDRGHDFIVKTSVQLADALLNQLNQSK